LLKKGLWINPLDIVSWWLIMRSMEDEITKKKGRMLRVPEVEYRKFRRREKQLFRIKILLEQIWNIFRKIQ